MIKSGYTGVVLQETAMMPSTAFDDMESDLASAPVRAPSAAQAAAPVYTQPCPKCRGTGRYLGPSSHGNVCFKCNGARVLTFKTSPFERLKAAQQRAQREERKAGSRWEEFKAANEAEAEWILRRAESFDFAAQMHAAVQRWGNLTPGQLGAVRKCMASDLDREMRRQQAAEERKAAEAAAPTVAAAPLEKVEQAFANALAKGVRTPKLRLDTFVLSPAKASSKNAGAIYVTSKERTGEDGRGAYLGKIIGGRFLKVRECSPDEEQRIVAAASDPEKAAVAYGQRFGACSVCGRELTDSTSIDRGIGPICASRMGW
jgi:hypothetical protein